MKRLLVLVPFVLSACSHHSAVPHDGGTGADAKPVDAGADAATTDGATGPSCGTDGWPTYGHDSRRTFTSDGCITGNLAKKWTYVPAPPSGRTANAFNRAIAQSDAVFLQWAASADPYTGTTAADRVTVDGARVWTFDSGTDSNLKFWPTFAMGSLFLDDDGVYVLDGATGTKTADTGVDLWGQIAFDSTRMYATNVFKADGPGLKVWSFGLDTKPIWEKNTYAMCGEQEGDVAGGIALDGGVVFVTASYVFDKSPAPLASGVYALDAATGAQKWFVPYTPTSSISAGNGNVYFVDSSKDLVALSQKDGSVVWHVAVAASGDQAPVLIDGQVVVSTQTGLSAFTLAGAPSWSAPITSPTFLNTAGGLSNGCSGGTYAVQGTTIAGAAGSHTLVVTTSTGLVVFSTADGRPLWSDATLGALHDPIVVGKRVYALDATGLVAFE